MQHGKGTGCIEPYSLIKRLNTPQRGKRAANSAKISNAMWKENDIALMTNSSFFLLPSFLPSFLLSFFLSFFFFSPPPFNTILWHSHCIIWLQSVMLTLHCSGVLQIRPNSNELPTDWWRIAIDHRLVLLFLLVCRPNDRSNSDLHVQCVPKSSAFNLTATKRLWIDRSR